MAKIIAPNKQYTGLSASVSFINGVGETDDLHLIKWFKDKGYEVEQEKITKLPIDDKTPNRNENDNVDPPLNFGIDDLTKDQIKEKLDEMKIEYASNENKDALFEKLIDALENPQKDEE